MIDCAVSNAACMLCKRCVHSQLDGVGTHVGWPYVNLLSLNCLYIDFVSTLAYSSLMVRITSQVCCAAAGVVRVFNEHAGNNVWPSRESRYELMIDTTALSHRRSGS